MTPCLLKIFFSLLFSFPLIYTWNTSTPAPNFFSCWCIVFISVRVNFLNKSWIISLGNSRLFSAKFDLISSTWCAHTHTLISKIHTAPWDIQSSCHNDAALLRTSFFNVSTWQTPALWFWLSVPPRRIKSMCCQRTRSVSWQLVVYMSPLQNINISKKGNLSYSPLSISGNSGCNKYLANYHGSLILLSCYWSQICVYGQIYNINAFGHSVHSYSIINCSWLLRNLRACFHYWKSKTEPWTRNAIIIF